MSKTSYCPHCGRDDVPVCEKCKNRVPHGFTWGTWLPCDCDGSNRLSAIDVVHNIAKEAGVEIDEESFAQAERFLNEPVKDDDEKN